MRKLLILGLVLMMLVPMSIHAQEEENIYNDPNGLYSVPIPTNWTVTENEGYALLTSPENEIEVYLLVSAETDLPTAIEAGWQQVIPDFALEAVDTQVYDDPALTGGTERAAVITYTDPNDAQLIYQGVGFLHESQSYLMLYKGNITAFQQRNAQVSIINTGFKIASLEVTDLAGVAPLLVTEDIIAALETYIAEKMVQLEVAGASIAIVQDGEIIYAKGFGVRNEAGAPVTPDTRMMIGSTTKTMTTMLMGILVDEGKLAWDTPVTEILPNFALADPERTQQITVENLVCACTGVPRRDLELIFNYNDQTAESVIESMSDFELFTDFGEAFQYSNQMVATGGYVAAAAAGGEYGDLYTTYEALMEEKVFAPIGMDSTTFSFEEVAASEDYAIPFVQDVVGGYEPAPLAVEEWLNIIAPAGAAWSTANDMANYVITELNNGTAPNGTQVISSENLSYTWQPQVQMSAESSYGLGWIIDSYKGVKILSHAGNTLGFTSEMAFLPEYGLGIVILTNQRASIFNEAVSYRLLELVYEQEPEFEAQLAFALQMMADSVAEFESQLVDIPNMESLAGTYTNAILGDMTLEVRDGVLYANAGEFETEIRALENEKGEIAYVFYDAPLGGLTFTLSEDGKTLVLGEGIIEYTFERQ